MITYLLDETGISPRVQSVLAQADALIERGHDVRIVTTADMAVTWRPSRARWEFVDDFASVTSDIVLDGSFPWSEFLIVDEEMYRSGAPREHEPPRVLLAGASQNDDGIEDGYGAAAHARWFHQKFDLIRVSPWVPSREEPLDSVQEFHVGLTSAEMTRLMHSCDLLIAARDHTLPAAEAMAAGVPVVQSANRNAVELGERLIEILSDADLRERLREEGRKSAEQWRAACVAERLEAFFRR